MSDNITLQFEEFEVLRSIYLDNVCVKSSPTLTTIVRYEDKKSIMEIIVPEEYPLNEPALVHRIAIVGGARTISCMDITNMISDMMLTSAGSETIYQAIEMLRDYVDKLDASPASDSNNYNDNDNDIVLDESVGDFETPHQYKEHTSCSMPPQDTTMHIYHGEPLTDRGSVFQAHVAVVRSMTDVMQFRETLLQDKKIASATHNIFAYRFTSSETGVVYHDCDDDGEKAAGSRLAELLRLMKQDGIAVIVSRYFGGTLLGPDRFRLINNAARNLIEDVNRRVGSGNGALDVTRTRAVQGNNKKK